MANWPEIKAQAEDPQNYISGLATDHYHRYKEDFAIMRDLHLNAFRFSVEWSRLEPKEGEWNWSEFKHYKLYIQALKKEGIEPVMTLFHYPTAMVCRQRRVC